MKNTMFREVLEAPCEIKVEKDTIPHVKDDQVLVEIAKIGISGSDIRVYHGIHPNTSYPITQGHEGAGTIAKIGSNVTDLEIGQKVAINPLINCGHCYSCKHGNYYLCENQKVYGIQVPGMACEYFAVEASKVIPLPAHMSCKEGAMAEPVAIALHAARKYGDLQRKKVAILGAGSLTGLLLCELVKYFGASKVLAADTSDYRLTIAQKFGADYILNSKNKDFGSCLQQHFGQNKVDVIYNCSNENESMNQAIINARRGSTIVLATSFSKMASIDLEMLKCNEVNLQTSSFYTLDEFREALELIHDKVINVNDIVCKTFKLSQYQEAYSFIERNMEKAIKVQIDVSNNEKNKHE